MIDPAAVRWISRRMRAERLAQGRSGARSARASAAP